MYPNPVDSELIIDFDYQEEFVIVKICDMTGKLVGEFELSGASSITLYLSEFEPGVYFVELNGESWRCSERVVKR
ncbi:MAG: T9SS type A sorting domain-containing protein [Fluviicola sp.]